MVLGFEMPVRVGLGDGPYGVLTPTESWPVVAADLPSPEAFRVYEDDYVRVVD